MQLQIKKPVVLAATGTDGQSPASPTIVFSTTSIPSTKRAADAASQNRVTLLRRVRTRLPKN